MCVCVGGGDLNMGVRCTCMYMMVVCGGWGRGCRCRFGIAM